MGRKAVYSDELKARVAENLLHDSYYDTALKFRLDQRSKNKGYLRNLVKSFYVDVKEDPDRYGIAPEVFPQIEEQMQKRMKLAQSGAYLKESAVSRRKKSKPNMPVGKIRTDEEMKALQAKGDDQIAKAEDLRIDRKAIKLRDTMTRILERKLDIIEGSNDKELAKLDLVRLTTAFGTLVDKAQLLQGNATEHIALYARVNNIEDMTPDDAMKNLLKAREVAIEQKK